MIAKNKIRRYQGASFALFVITVTLGYLGALLRPDASTAFVVEALRGFEFVQNMSSLEIFLFIFFNNTVKSFFAIVLGIIFAPLFFIAVNGLLLGMVIRVAGMKVGYLKLIASLLAHGSLELFGVLVAAGYGWWLGIEIWKKILGKNQDFDLKESIFYVTTRFAKIVVPLLLIAALIETYISPRILNYLEK